MKGALIEKVSEDDVLAENKGNENDLTFKEAQSTIGAGKSVRKSEMKKRLKNEIVLD
jgi:type II secretory pathway component PulC